MRALSFAAAMLVLGAGSLSAQTTPTRPPAAPAQPAATNPQAARPANPPAPQAAPDTNTLPPQEIGTIALGSTRNGLLEAGDYTMGDATWADVWYFNATAGQRLTIEVRSTRFDPYMQVLDPWGNKLGEDDDSGDGNSARVVFSAREAGRYQIVVNVSGDTPRTGHYLLSVR